jgi:hypothetical protein
MKKSVYGFVIAVLVLAGCDQVTDAIAGGNPDTGDETFVAVENITLSETSRVKNTVIDLNALAVVTPEDATNTDIEWFVLAEGTTVTGVATDAVVAGGIVTPTAAGTLTLSATVANGEAEGADYVEVGLVITVTDAFVPVTDIEWTPPTGKKAGEAFEISGFTVAPPEATNKTITSWTASGAGLSGTVTSPVTPTEAGTLTLTATIASGKTNGTEDYTQDFTVTVATSYTITIDPSMTNGTVAAKTDSADPASSAAEGETVTLTVTPDPDYQLENGSLKVNDSADGISGYGPYTFTMPANNVTVTAVFEAADEPVDVPENYIPIASAAELAKIGNPDETDYPLVGQYFQTKNITISGTWTPIGSDGTPFTGEYDGNGKVITPNAVTSTENLGVFGYADGATFKNIRIGNGSMISPDKYVGGIAAKANNTTFTNSSNAATLEGLYTGGICGYLADDNSIDTCWNTGTITGDNAGGICGVVVYDSDHSVMKNCYNSGAINGRSLAGGIGGSLYGGNIVACYNIGTVTTTTGTEYQFQANAGGIAGDISDGAITACYNNGSVSSNAPTTEIGLILIGGVVGGHYETAAITASYSTGTLSWTGMNGGDGSVSIGGITGLTAFDDNTTIAACYWAGTEVTNGIGYKEDGEGGGAVSDEGTARFVSGSAWPANTTHADWGTTYWKTISNGSYPKLAWEK